MTIADKLTLLAGTKQAIKQAIEDKGVTVGEVPFADYPAKIAAIEGGGETSDGWTRPADWLPLPEVTETDQIFVGLHAIYPDANFLALSAAGAYTVDWGDGAVENFAAAAIAEHEYTYSTISASTESSRGYRQVVVTVTPQAGQSLTMLDLNQRHSEIAAITGAAWLDVSISGPSLTSSYIGKQAPLVYMAALEQVSIIKCGVSDFSYFFAICRSLQSVPIIDTTSAVNFSYMFNNCASLKSISHLDTSSGTIFTSMFSSCFALESIPPLDTSLGTNFSGMFSNCTALALAPSLDVSLGTTFSSMFTNCASLRRIEATGFKVNLSLLNLKLSAERLNEVYANLATVTSATIGVTGSFGTSGDNPSIATAKGWTVTG